MNIKDLINSTKPLQWFTYSQNNSGGRFHKDMPLYLHVEAPSADMANARAVEQGAYFDGCEQGMDCECCGDRWSDAYGEGYEDRPEPGLDSPFMSSFLSRTAGVWYVPWNGPVEKIDAK